MGDRQEKAVVGIALALPSAESWSAEEWVLEDWTAVAQALNGRMKELNWRQYELVARASVSRAIISEIQNNRAQRDRHKRTLQALSTALGWHQNHLDAVLMGDLPPDGDDPPVVRSDKDTPGRITAIEHEMRQVRADVRETRDNVQQIMADVRQIKEILKPPSP
jgi:uncharacterized coiled-coil DUF342 family protein